MTSTPTILRVALYARVSSDRQADEGTVASQVEALRQRIAADGHQLDPEMSFLDEGSSGSTLLRPALERLRDQAAAGTLDCLYVLDPDRLARQYVYQFLLLREFQEAGVTVVFLNRALGPSPEDNLLLQVQGVIAEYERAKIKERCRRGKLHAAQQGQVAVLGKAPYGYRYVRKQDGNGIARYEIDWEKAQVVRQIFTWVVAERLSLRAVGRRLEQQGIPSPAGKPRWPAAAISRLLGNPAYQGTAYFGKTCTVARQPQRLRPARGHAAVPRRPVTVIANEESQRIKIAVPALVSAELFAAAAEQLTENRRRCRAQRTGARHLLQGLVVCAACGYGWCASTRHWVSVSGEVRTTCRYRCGGWLVTGGDGQPVCQAPSLAAAELEEAVWQDVVQLLRQPAQIEEEYERRWQGAERPGAADTGSATAAGQVAKVKKTIARLIDSYSEGLLEKAEFEPRLRAARERLARLEAAAQTEAEEQAGRAELRLVIGHLQAFAERIQEGLQAADWALQRGLIRALVRHIEVSAEAIRIVYKIAPVPFVEAPNGGFAQDCRIRYSGPNALHVDPTPPCNATNGAGCRRSLLLRRLGSSATVRRCSAIDVRRSPTS